MDISRREPLPSNYNTSVDQYEDDNKRNLAAAHGSNASTETGRGSARASGSVVATATHQRGKVTSIAVGRSKHGTVVTEVVDDDEEDNEPPKAEILKQLRGNSQRGRTADQCSTTPSIASRQGARPTNCSSARSIDVTCTENDEREQRNETSNTGNQPTSSPVSTASRSRNWLTMFNFFKRITSDKFRSLRNNKPFRLSAAAAAAATAVVVLASYGVLSLLVPILATFYNSGSVPVVDVTNTQVAVRHFDNDGYWSVNFVNLFDNGQCPNMLLERSLRVTPASQCRSGISVYRIAKVDCSGGSCIWRELDSRLTGVIDIDRDGGRHLDLNRPTALVIVVYCYSGRVDIELDFCLQLRSWV